MLCAEKSWLIDRNRLIWRDWVDESVIFDRRSGQTLLFDLVSREALKCLESHPYTRSELCKVLASRLGVEVDSELDRYVDEFVGRLEILGLIEVAR